MIHKEKTLPELRELMTDKSIELSNTPNKTVMDRHERFKIMFTIRMIMNDIDELIMQQIK